MLYITVRVYHRHYEGDTSSHIESHLIRKDCLHWWQERSGKGDFDLISWRDY